jgi:ubiquinol-cytochrome c reductase cytochrome b subunit
MRLFWFFFTDSITLGWIGQEIVETPFIETALFVTVNYFSYFLILLPFLGFLENSFVQNTIKALFKFLIIY